MIPGLIIFSMACLWLGGAMYGNGSLTWLPLTALGAGWLAIIYESQRWLLKEARKDRSSE